METVTQYIAGNPIVALIAVFAGGLLSASSPCVLAIMPMVIGYVGGHSSGNRKKAIQYSLLFALGLSITFTLLGAVAAIFGQLFGDVGKFWYWIVAVIAVAMGLSLMLPQGLIILKFEVKPCLMKEIAFSESTTTISEKSNVKFSVRMRK